MVHNDKPGTEVFMKKALDAMIESRRAIAWTYPVGFFIKD